MRYIVRRVAQSVFTVFAVVSLSFGIVRLLPGGPADYLRAQLLQQGGSLTQSQINQRIAAQTNVNVGEPLYVQYVDYMVNVLQGDFGRSIWYDDSVASILGKAIPWTVFIMACALLLAFVVGITLGAFMAYREGSSTDYVGTAVSLVTNSTPDFIVGLVALTFLGYRFGLFPTTGHYASEVTPGLNLPFVVSVVHHGTLPILAISLYSFGGWAMDMRANSIRVLGEDYLRVARLRGLPERRIALRYVARNAILPMYTGLLIAIGFVFGGAIIIERIFGYPGLGYYLIGAIDARDYPLMMGGFIVICVAVTIGVLIADLTYGIVDPRAGGGDRESY
ncbi:ABC transporter permease [Halorarum halophilum]|uniref:ABC transporter permease n=1 Tax=Halorarum halophilum TaxID=2743090 RepID=A0A7D5KXZ7_9EURY|nr:ABC transporter permease [Halobaculum halophilum]QLG29118.1 ABC transporter permease [Halobaculum halophilum]